MTKRKAEYRQTGMEIAPGNREQNEGMEADLFENLLESVREAGAILRGERETGHRTYIDEAAELSSSRDQE